MPFGQHSSELSFAGRTGKAKGGKPILCSHVYASAKKPHNGQGMQGIVADEGSRWKSPISTITISPKGTLRQQITPRQRPTWTSSQVLIVGISSTERTCARPYGLVCIQAKVTLDGSSGRYVQVGGASTQRQKTEEFVECTAFRQSRRCNTGGGRKDDMAK